MAEHGWFGCDVVRPPEATREQLLAVHPASHIDYIEELCAGGGGHIDMDTVAMAATYEAAVRSAGGAVALVDALLSGEAAHGLLGDAAARPPRRAAAGDGLLLLRQRGGGGAARGGGARGRAGARSSTGTSTTATGPTRSSTRTRACCSSRSTSGRCIRGPGPASDLGAGDGEGYTVNLPVPGGSGDETYRSLVDHVVLPLMAAWEPGLVLVSAGFDAHSLDPLATCRVTERGYAEMTASLRRACAAVGAPLGLILEGGYSLEALTGSVAALMPVLTADSPPAETDAVALHPLAADARGAAVAVVAGRSRAAQRGTTRRA